MLAVRQQDAEALRQHYTTVDEPIHPIDGLQPENGHQTLYVVSELTQKRARFAEPLISAAADEVWRLISKAKECYVLWTRTPRIPSRSPRKTCRLTGQPENHRAKNRHWTVAEL
jgi:hypothetical protein